MAKRTGAGQRLLVCQIGSGPASDISGDTGSIDTAVTSFGLMDDTGIDKSAMERLPLEGDGSLAFTSFWNNAAGGSHAVLKGLNGLPVRALWLGSTTEGDGLGFGISGIFESYAPNRPQSASLTAKNSVKSYNGDFPHWGSYVGYPTDASGANHTGFDLGTVGPALTITNISVANPTHVTVTAHGLVTGDSVTIAGSNSTPSINGDWPVTVLDANTFTVPVNVTVLGSAGTATKTSGDLGVVLMVLLKTIGSNNLVVTLQHSADNGVSDAYANLSPSVATGNLNAGAAEAYVRSAGTTIVKRWARIVTSGGFTNANFAYLVKRIGGAE